MMTYKVVVDGETTLNSRVDGDPNCFLGGGISTEPLTITQNGTFVAAPGKAYTPIVADVPDGIQWASDEEGGF